MKIVVFLILISTAASATETKTECPWIKQMQRRTNPKPNMNLANLKTKSITTKAATTSAQ
jgi:hypothetical protein